MALGLFGRALVTRRIDVPGMDIASGGTILWEGTGPLLKSNAGELAVRNAGDSAYASVNCNSLIASSNVVSGATNNHTWSGRSRMYSSASGNINMTDATVASFTSLAWGLETSAFPMWKRSGTNMFCRLADDSNYATLQAASVVANGSYVGTLAASRFHWAGRSRLYSSADGKINMTNDAANGFTSLAWGPETSSFPMLKANGTTLELKRADDLAWGQLSCNNAYMVSHAVAGSTGFFGFATRSRLYSSADGKLSMTDDAAASFTSLAWGLETSAFPMLKQNGLYLQIRRADDLAYGNLQCNDVSATNWAGNAAGFVGWGSQCKLYSGMVAQLEVAGNGSGTACHVRLNEFASGADPAAADANSVRLYVRDNGSGKGELCARFPTGAIQVVASEP